MAKKDSKAKRPRAAAQATAAPETARDLGTKLGETIRGAAPDIVNALIEQAKAGNCTPAKFLFDFAGLVSASAPDPAADECLAALLLRELKDRGAGDEPPGTVQ
ncbi:MAG TPA: hypothetical protein VMS96_08580 [Terriglobales bacterium]|nr:hypothetical protein [Terriglobales bacterium]